MEQVVRIISAVLLAQFVLVRGDSEACGSNRPRDITGLSGVFQTPNYPSNYPNNANCQWRITSPDPDAQVLLDFEDFETESRYDWLNVYDGSSTSDERVLRYSGAGRPSPIESSGDVMLVEFTTDSSVTRRGFSARFLVEQACGSSAPRVITDATGSVNSPYYPGNYSAGLNCSWTIQALAGDQVQMSFEDFDLEESETENCRWDYLDVYDGNALVGRYCGSDLPPSFISESGEVRLLFKSDLAIEGRGFKANFESANGATNPPTTAQTTVQTDLTTNDATTTVTVPTAGPPQTPGLYLEISLSGVATSTNGEDISPFCAAEYSASMRVPLALVIVNVNAALGSSICAGADDVFIETGSVTAGAAGSSVGVQITVYLAPSSTKTFATHNACSREIVEYIGDFSNWRDPIIEDIFGCPALEFSTQSFQSAGTAWAC